ncbi:DUF4422 domain-containing protein [Gluconacetobacter sp. Hr-1-5]|uniref:DUF4422 domain-containing protein n=1 Tax=Gluconacetobacter sp. Hr-1-5 TaxID=3395370 RepID=UPI003B51613E
MDIKIYVYHHTNTNIHRNRYFEPIQGGRAIANVKFAGMIGDDTGDTISARNREWCELTVLYWIWKNTQHDYVGLNTEKSYLIFSELAHQKISILNKNIEFIDFCSQNIESSCQNHTILTAPLCKIHPHSAASHVQTFYENYCFEHEKKDIDCVLTLIKNNFSVYYEAALLTAHIDSKFNSENILLRRDIFDQYCDFIFSVLFLFERTVDTSHRNNEQKKVFKFIYSFLSTVFLMKHFVYGEKETFFHAGEIIIPKFSTPYDISKITYKHPPKERPIKYSDRIHIVISFDDKYIDHAMVSLYSLLDNTENRNSVHFHVLHDERLSHANIKKMHAKFPINQFDFYNVSSDTFSNIFPNNRPHISKNTYYRLIMHEFLPDNIGRFIYSDLDTIYCDDITLLWNMDLKEKTLGGCMDEGGITHSRKLFGKKYNKSYINAGVFVIDLHRAKEKYGNLKFLYMESFVKNIKNITLQDQDIINIAFKDDIELLPLRWNAGGRLYGHNEQDVAYSDLQQAEAAKHPAILHFTGEVKPWVASCEHPLKNLYFFYRAKMETQENDHPPPSA